MVRVFLTVLLCAALSAMPVARAAPPQGVALVLSGGGARGVAHLGVLRVLERLRVPVDCVVGTSMGAIVGGAYAAGMDLDDMERAVREADWTAMFAGRVAREDQPFRDKQDVTRNRSAVVMGYGDGRLLLPQSAVSGQAMDRFLQGLAGGAEVLHGFDTLPLPYRAIATDLESGAMVLLERGALWRAMRASMAVPGVFLPIEDQGRLLVDGGLVMNLPVDAGRALCGGRVIAVNLGTPPYSRERLQSATDIVLQAINLALEQNVRQQLERLGPEDALIQVDLADITSHDFERVLEAIPLGVTAALAETESLARFSVDEATYARWQAQRRALWRTPAPLIERVEVDGLRYVPKRSVLGAITQKHGVAFDAIALESDIGRIYNRGDFERLRYSLVRHGHAATLKLEADERASGPNLLRFGGGLAADLMGGGQVGLYAGFSRRWLNTRGARWDVDLQLGTTNRLRSQLYQPLDLDSGWFVAPSLEASNRMLPVFIDGEKVFENRERSALVGLDAGYELGAWGELRAGWARAWRKTDVFAGQGSYVRGDDGWLHASAVIDRLDSPFFARRGYALRLDTEWHSRAAGSDANYRYGELEGDLAYSSGAHVWRLRTLLAGSPDRDLPDLGRVVLGGPFQLSGYRYGEATADQAGLVALAWYRQVGALPDALGRGIYVGSTLEWAKLRSFDDAYRPEVGVRRVASLFLGADTVLGPLYVGASYSPELRAMRYYLQLGQPY